MVYLSEATLHPRVAGRCLGDLYALHQLVYAAFPAGTADGDGRILFRLEAGVGRGDDRPRLLVQSDREPDWEGLAGQILCVRGPKAWEPRFQAGQSLRFRLRASPTKRVFHPRGHPKAGHQRTGLLTRPEQAAWLRRQGERHGYALRDTPDWFDAFDGTEPRASVQIVSLGHLKGRKYAPGGGGGGVTVITHLAVDFDGLLEVTDPSAFAQTVAAGVGPGRAFGFGLLSVAPV